MIDPTTGELTLDTGELLGPGLTRSAFLASPLAATAAPPVQAPGAPLSYVDLGPRAIGAQGFVVGLAFEGEALRTVTLTMVQAAEASSWDDWSPDAELARKARHDAWLEGSLGPLPWWFGWGEVVSQYDPRGGSSNVMVRYGGQAGIACSLTLDKATGDLTLGTGQRIGRGLTRTAFLASALAGGLGRAAPLAVAARAAFPVDLRLPGGDAAALTLHFEGEALVTVVMSMLGPHEPPAADYRRAWADDQALASLLLGNEQARKARHDAWLATEVGPGPWSYPWGTVASQLDTTFCASQVLVAYR